MVGYKSYLMRQNKDVFHIFLFLTKDHKTVGFPFVFRLFFTFCGNFKKRYYIIRKNFGTKKFLQPLWISAGPEFTDVHDRYVRLTENGVRGNISTATNELKGGLTTICDSR